MNICLFNKSEIDKPLHQNDERAIHIRKVLHKKEGESFDAGIINGMAGIATITKISETGEIYFSFTETKNGKELYPLTLIIGFPRPIQLRRLLRDVASLGVKTIILTGTELGEKSYLNSNIITDGSAYKMLLDGSVQAASTHIPELVFCKSLKESIDLLDDPNSSIRISLDNKNPETNLGDFLRNSSLKNQNIIAAIGSERGWTDNERFFLKKARFTHCSMGIRILRTETAATVASSLILNEMGFLQ